MLAVKFKSMAHWLFITKLYKVAMFLLLGTKLATRGRTQLCLEGMSLLSSNVRIGFQTRYVLKTLLFVPASKMKDLKSSFVFFVC